MPNTNPIQNIKRHDRITVIRDTQNSSHRLNPIGPSGPGGTTPPVIGRAILESARRRVTETALTNKWQSLGGAPGAAVNPGSEGLVENPGGYYREYAWGRIYHSQTGNTCWLYGAIGEKYLQLGGTQCWLGWPTSDEEDFAQEGRANTFTHGAIYWWPDTGPIDLGDVVVRYKGLFCFGETDDDQLSFEDEPYVIFGIVPVSTENRLEIRTRIYGEDDDPFGGVDAGDSREDNIELYRGLPYGMALGVTLMEHDFGDPEKYKAQVKIGVDKASEAVVFGTQHIPILGPTLAKVAEPLLEAVGPTIVNTINDLLDTQDDILDMHGWAITAREMVLNTRRSVSNFHGIEWHLDSPLFSGQGASYKVYFSVEAA